MSSMDENYPFRHNDESVRKPKYKGYTTNSVYIKMRDGIQIAAEVYLPKKLPENTKVSTVLAQTRYWRAYNFKWPIKWFMKPPRQPWVVKGLTSHGLAVVWIDVRGTGASYGTRPYPFSEEEIKDGAEVINWIINQPWSDGNVVTWGNSYSGVTSEMVSLLNHPAVKGIIAKHNPWDLYMHAAFPNGVFCKGFIENWSNLGRALDTTKGKNLAVMKAFDLWLGRLASIAVHGVMPVDNEHSLEEISQIHQENSHPIDYFERVKARDDPLNDQGATIDLLSAFSKKQIIEKAGIPFYTFGSWQDSTTANAVIHRFLNFDIPQRAVITDNCHRDKFRASPFFAKKAHAKPDRPDQIRDWVMYYRDCINRKSKPEKILYYFTMGEEKWKKTTTWPPANQQLIRWYLDKNNTLSQVMPQEKSGVDDYTIDYDVTTGIRNRWYTLLSLPVEYPNREEADKKLLCYTSKPFEQDIEVTGHPILNLFLKSTHEDGMLHIHFEFIDEKGKVHWITDGQLRLIHRKISLETPPYKMAIPYHSFLRKDMHPLIPGEIAEVIFALYPTSIVLKRGFRMRIAIAGADKDTFGRYPEEGIPTISVERNSEYSSYIDLPIIR